MSALPEGFFDDPLETDAGAGGDGDGDGEGDDGDDDDDDDGMVRRTSCRCPSRLV